MAINRFMLHRFTHEPFGLKYRPGIVMGQWGTHFDRTQTWWEPGKAYVQYLTRCQGLLQWGADATQADDFQAEGEGAEAIRRRHRRGPAGDVFFVANTERAVRKANCTFAITSRQPEWLDPVTGTTRALVDFTFAEGRTTIPLSFEPGQSGFVVFRKEVETAPVAHPGNDPERRTLSEVPGPWQVQFDPNWGGPSGPVAFDALVDWTSHPEAGICYFSGTAVYRAAFDLPTGVGTGAGVSLDLGVVHDLARVRVNGVDCGVVWTAPWRVSVPAGAIKPSGNQLEIEVTNCWANRLIGDEQEPPDCEWLPGYYGHGGYLKKFPAWFVNGGERPSKGRYTFTTWNYFTKDSKLKPSGLLGPVRVVADPGD